MQKYEALIIDEGRHHNGFTSQQLVKNILDDVANLVGYPFAPYIGGIETTRLSQVATKAEAERFSFSHQVEVR